MSHYILSIGSNTPDKAGKMAEALQWLDREFGQITVSGIYATKAWSGNAPDYLNMVACVQSSLSAEEMNLKAKEFEPEFIGKLNALFTAHHKAKTTARCRWM